MSSDKTEKTRKKNPAEKLCDKLWLSFNDMKTLGIVTNWQSLRHWQQHHGFPTGRLFAANSRRWSREEIDAWLASRPTARAEFEDDTKHLGRHLGAERRKVLGRIGGLDVAEQLLEDVMVRLGDGKRFTGPG